MADEMQQASASDSTSTSDEQQYPYQANAEEAEADNDDESDSRGEHSRRGGFSRRRMPGRVSKDNFNRVCSIIMKPNKKKRKELQANEPTLKSIEKIYTSKRMKKFTPTNLQTIFEEPSDENENAADAEAEDDSEEQQVRPIKFGARKLRRAISFGDGLNKNKLLAKKRRQKVKKTFGKRFALNKITMTEFHDRLNKSFDSAMAEGDGDGEGDEVATPAASAGAAVTMDDMQLPTSTSTAQSAGLD